MLTLPIPLIFNLLVGLLALGTLALAIHLLSKAAGRWRQYPSRGSVSSGGGFDQSGDDRVNFVPVTPTGRWREPAVRRPLIAGAALLLFTFGGRYFVQFLFPAGPDEPASMRTGVSKTLAREDGSTLHVEVYGSANAPALVFTHGWGTSSEEWYYAKRHLSDRFRLILWDLPGLGKSAQPPDRDFALDRLAADLRSVVLFAGQPVVLVGHSIGGMINLTFCRRYPELLGAEVTGIVQLDTSYTNPVRTTKNSDLSLALQKPVAEPLLHVMIGLSPLVRAMNWLSYQSGLAQLMNAQSAFAGSETRGQLDLVSRYQYRSSPAVVARGTLAMFHWDATSVLPRVSVPVLLIVGQQDTTTLPSASEYMQHKLGNSRLQYVDPSAHYALLEQNETVDAAIAQFASVYSSPQSIRR